MAQLTRAAPAARWRWVLLIAIAPVAWGATYFVTRQVLPADAPFWGSALRALPAGLVLLLLARRLPRGSWWWRSTVLGVLNVGAFFLLVYVAAQLLPTSVASSIMALAPLVLAGCAWVLIAERPAAPMLVGALLGIAGVVAIVGLAGGALPPEGVAASASALVLSSFGAVLTKRWAEPGVPLVAMTAWQLVAGGLLLTVVAIAVEGAPPPLGPTELAGFAFVSLIATALAFVCWFGGLANLTAGSVGVIGLLNPVTGVLLGALVASEPLAPAQLAGIALVLAGLLVAQRRAAPQAANRVPWRSRLVPRRDRARDRPEGRDDADRACAPRRRPGEGPLRRPARDGRGRPCELGDDRAGLAAAVHGLAAREGAAGGPGSGAPRPGGEHPVERPER
ncbi:DMT family transporter [Agromyces aerolatus]|uniref:DMT family transporter n=1 Tax=Agromyces sp. LY-1074 TaxID=3074080 RepID=UPI00285B67B7|nr:MULTISPECIES: EamA family transporter [unclassified Agromyces]MDR5701843.1 EamA family transporter [Agromyces sp. LY-1074]MDR5708084.1 EamA family transporter [Agromyces sp. LY-1358]